jgi:hypothetical protein
MSSGLVSLAGAFSSGASAVAVIVAEASSPLVLLLLVLALLARVRGVRCDISVLLYTVNILVTVHLCFSLDGSNGRAAAVVVKLISADNC